MLRLDKPHLKLPIRRTGAHKDDDQVLSRGQIIVLFAAALPVMIGILGLAIDVSFAWITELRIQKTADAAALAGAVYLPDNTSGATGASLASATQNGYTGGTGSINGSPSISIIAARNEPMHQQMDVSITAPVPTFFMRVFGYNYLMATRTAHAQYNLPLPMGSPLNTFGSPSATDLQGQTLNYWAAIQGPCTLKQNGDPYAVRTTTESLDKNTNCSAMATSNSEYKPPSAGDPGAYDYTIKVTGGGTLAVSLYDPEYCPRTNTHWQFHDTGEGTFSSYDPPPGVHRTNFDTTFTLYNPSATPYILGSYTIAAQQTYPGDGGISPGQSCSSTYIADYSHTFSDGETDPLGKWVGFASIAASPGTYRLNIQTSAVGSSPADGSNMYSISATLNGGSSGVSVYGGAVGTMSSMSIYNNLQPGTSNIYLAQINSTNAGKALVLDLFDPGDVGGTGVMYFEMPTTSGWTDATFSWRDSGDTLSGAGTLHSGVTSVTTASGGNSNFQGHWVVVTINIPGTYTAPQNGWWKIKYVISGAAAHDRTTWNAQVIDIPVHLVP